jgi:putative membrane protein (TIGR04086 family)
MKRDRTAPQNSGMLISVAYGAIVGAALSVVLILLYALILQQGWLESTSITIVNTIIKLLCAAAASVFAVRRCEKNRWVYGAIAGLVYTLLAFVVFSVLSSDFAPTLALLSDIGMGMICGMFAAMLTGYFR